jgi:O-antigen/teichoic acid export membrane protein
VVATAVKESDWGEVNRLARQVSLHQLLVSLIIFFVIWINLPTLYAFIPNGASYAGGVGVVLLLGLAKVVNSSFSIATDVLNYSRLYSRSLLFIGLLTLSAVLLNTWFIDLWGIDGSATATLCSYLLYFVVLLAYLWWRLRVGLFSWGHMKVVVLMVAAFALGTLWSTWVSPLIAPSASMLGLVADAIVKTVVLTALLVVGVVAWHVSPSIDDMVRRLQRKQKKQK